MLQGLLLELLLESERKQRQQRKQLAAAAAAAGLPPAGSWDHMQLLTSPNPSRPRP